MNELTQSPAWRALASHHETLARSHLTELFAADTQRFERFSLRLGELLFDFSKQRITTETLDLLLRLADARQLRAGLTRMAAGEEINFTEKRAALHIALRADRPYHVDGKEVTAEVRATRERVGKLCDDIRKHRLLGARGKPIRRVVNLGIGGSDLGPRMAARALADYAGSNVRVDFVANVDPRELDDVLRGADPDETLFILSSKSFSTIETLSNAEAAKAWLVAALGSTEAVQTHFVAVSNNVAAAQKFGIAAQRCFALPEWVGGRYSMWSAIGLPLACAVGMERFEELLAGAREMDDHFLTAPWRENMPVIMALLGIWNIDFLGAGSLAVLPYAHALADLPAYLQQLEMESNGKRVHGDGSPVDCATAPILWGGAGTVGQHAYHQLLYQGTRIVPADFIVVVGENHPQQHTLVANALAQSAALMRGKTEAAALAELLARGVADAEAKRLAPHMACPGNQPSSTVLMPQLTPHTLGQLIALYEHKVFVQGWIWGINSFDQYGVELGKQMARAVAAGDGQSDLDGSTAGLMRTIGEMRAPRKR
jgi:glucose-6-phosphate isomerase